MLIRLPKGKMPPPLGMVISIGVNADTSTKAQYTTDFIQFSLFFCLWLYEYTKTASHRCTTYICFQGVQFHNAEGIIWGNAPDQQFLDVWSTTLFLDTQKISIREELTSMEASGPPHGDAVPTTVHRSIHLYNNRVDLQAPPYVRTTPLPAPSLLPLQAAV